MLNKSPYFKISSFVSLFILIPNDLTMKFIAINPSGVTILIYTGLWIFLSIHLTG